MSEPCSDCTVAGAAAEPVVVVVAASWLDEVSRIVFFPVMVVLTSSAEEVSREVVFPLPGAESVAQVLEAVPPCVGLVVFGGEVGYRPGWASAPLPLCRARPQPVGLGFLSPGVQP